MRKPIPPPDVDECYSDCTVSDVMKLMSNIDSPLVEGKYIHWDKLRHKTPPEGMSHKQWWLGLKLRRQALAKQIPLVDRYGHQFVYTQPDTLLEAMYRLSSQASGTIEMPVELNSEDRDRYYFSSLVEEAITSSQLEGAATTRKVAKEMIRTNRQPQDRSERMILNNYQTMRRIGELRNESLSDDLVLEIHRIITKGTLDNPQAAGRFRTEDERIGVWDDAGILLHDPPPVKELSARMRKMCDFANGRINIPYTFLHPVLKAIILHFWLAYDHPFYDGNGRTARALFYWSMLNSGFWLFEFISISSILKRAPARYARSFLYTESDDNDVTYFVLYQMYAIERAIEELRKYIRRKTNQLKRLEAELRGMAFLNYRQKALVHHALKHLDYIYTIESHKRSHSVVYQTARTDLLDLVRRGLLNRRKMGRKLVFTAKPNLHEKLMSLEQGD